MLLPIALLALSSALPFRQEAAPDSPERPLRWLDVDGDGDLDALHLHPDGTLRLLRRGERGGYLDVTAQVGLEAVAGARALLAGDVDGDGRADLVVGGAAGLALWRQEEGGAFVDVTAGSGLEEAGPVLALDWIDLDRDGRPELHVEGLEAHRLYRRDRSGRFASVEELPGLDRLAAPPAARVDEAGGRDAARPSDETRALSAPRASSAGAASSPAASGSPPALGLPGCIKAINDQALPGSCLEASSVPGLGLLYPLSVDFNVDPTTGWVAINTVSPDTRLHVVGRGRFQGNSEADTGVGTGMLQVLSFDALTGLGIDSNEVQSWGAPLSLNPEGSFATRLNETLVVDPGGWVGIGREPTPNLALDVDGIVRAADTIVSTKPAGAPFQIASPDLNANLNADLLDGLDASAFSQFGPAVDSAELADGAVTDAKVAPGIAGEKVVPDFGAQVVRSEGAFESTGAGGGFASFNPNNAAASVRLDWLNDVARLRIGGNGPGANGGFDFQRTGNQSLLRVLDDGRVGLGTAAPAAGLHLVSDDGLVATGTLQAGTIPVEGPGARMLWYPGKGVFRAGWVEGTEWDEALVGLGSCAFGGNTIASGLYSTATGFGTESAGFLSLSAGNRTRADCFAVTALGRWNVGGGNPSSWVSTDPVLEVGIGADEAARTNALTVLKDGRIGVATAAPEHLLHVKSGEPYEFLVRAEATSTTAPTIAVYGSSVADGSTGVLAVSTGNGSSFGLRAIATGAGTPIAVSGSAPANGYSGFLPGRSYLETVGIGVLDPAAALDVAGDAIVGGPAASSSSLTLRDSGGSWRIEKEDDVLRFRGDSVAESHLVLDRTAGVGVFREDPQAAIDVQGWAPGDLMRVRRLGGTVEFRINSVGWVGIGKTPNAPLDVNGMVICTQLIETSDARLKRDVRELEGALEAVLALRGVSFEWDRAELPDAPEGRRLGLLAQEVREVLPEAVREDADGRLSVGYTSLVPVLVEGVGELHERVAGLERRLEEERAAREALAAQVARVEALLAPGGR